MQFSPPTWRPTLAQGHDGGSPSSSFERGVLVREDEQRASEHCAHDLSLHSDSSTVDDAQSLEAQLIRFFKKGFNDFLDIFGLYGVQVEDIGERNPDGSVVVAQSRITPAFAFTLSNRN